jgi:alpha-1,2-mannosyltransferase
MDRALDLLRSGAWLTRGRMRLIAVAVLIASGAALFYLVVTANGLNDSKGRPLGTDFSSFYAAGTYVLDGNPEAPFDLTRQHAREQQIFGANTPFYSWFYPPFFLLVAGALALMPYATALAIWQAVTLGLYLLTVRTILSSSPPPEGKAGPASDPLWILLALAFPAVMVNLGHGQNGFLTAALLGGALIQLGRRPIVAGVLFGLLAYKPQFGLMIPVALLAKGSWRTFAAAAATVALLSAATTAAFGAHVWVAFLDSTHFTRLIALEQGDVGWHKIQSVFAWARMWGATIPTAYTLQGAMDLLLGAALIWLWRSATPYPLKASALCLAAMLATPFALDYDMMALAPAIAFIVADGFARGFGPWEKTALAVLWLTPLVARNIAFVTLIPLGVPAMLAIFILLLRRSAFHIVFPMASPSAFLPK